MSSNAPGPRWQVHQIPRVAEAAVSRARLRLVPRRSSRRTRAARLPFVTLVSLVLLAGVIGLLCLNTSMQQSAFAQTDLDSQAVRLAARVETLQMETRALRSPQRLGEFAQSARGGHMVQPPTTCHFDVGTVGTVGAGGRRGVNCPDPATVVADPAAEQVRLHPARNARGGR